MKQGILAGILAYTLWGLLPGYWKAIQAVPPLEILCHRTIWSLLFVLLILAIPGLGYDEETLRRARVSSCEAFAAVTDHDNANVMAAEVAARLFVRSSERAERIYAAMCARGWRT